MPWPDWLARLPFLRSRSALTELTLKLQRSRREIEELRDRIEKQRLRLDDEKRRRERLERRLATVKITKASSPRSATPHRVAFQSAAPADRYRFATVVSYPKSGRTWFSTIYFYYARQVLGAPDLAPQSLHMPDRNLAFQQLLAERSKHGVFPVCVFTHLGFSGLKPFELEGKPWPDKAHTVLKRACVLIVRDPRDVVVSHYHHLRAMGGVLDPALALSEFIRGRWGVERIVRFMNLWADGLRARHKNLYLCPFESLKRDTAGTFAGAMRFLGNEVDEHAVAYAVEESRFDKLKNRERSSRSHSGASLEQDAFRFRKGNVGGYTQELSQTDAGYLDDVVSARLDLVFSLYHHPAPR